MDNTLRYDLISRLLHWTIAILLVGLVSLGWYMVSIEKQPNSGWYFGLHKSFGLVAATLILLRILWRLGHKPAPLPLSTPHWQATSARFIHFLLYVCMIIMPVTGFLGASFGTHGIALFGWPLPTWIRPHPTLSDQCFEIHGIVVWILVTLVTIHIIAALKHLFINNDGVFQRMWF